MKKALVSFLNSGKKKKIVSEITEHNLGSVYQVVSTLPAGESITIFGSPEYGYTITDGEPLNSLYKHKIDDLGNLAELVKPFPGQYIKIEVVDRGIRFWFAWGTIFGLLNQ